MSFTMSFIYPDWPTPAHVHSLLTTRCGGMSQGVYHGFNLGQHVGDDAATVAANRQWLHQHIATEQATPHCVWLEQIHSTAVIDAAQHTQTTKVPRADATFSRSANVVCTIMTADCLPVLLCDEAGSVVAAAHAGWRGLLEGVLEATVKSMAVAPAQLLAYLGPAISVHAFEVGEEVRQAFIAKDCDAANAFIACAPEKPNKYRADLYLLAKQRLHKQGVNKVFGGDFCTYNDHQRFFSYRRDGITGRQASLIWLSDEAN